MGQRVTRNWYQIERRQRVTKRTERRREKERKRLEAERRDYEKRAAAGPVLIKRKDSN